MIRYSLLSMFILFFCMYSLKDWYRGLLGMLFLVAFMERQDMPEQLLGIYGLAPFNVLLLFVILGMFLQRSQEDDGWRTPSYLKWSLIAMGVMILVGHYRLVSNFGGYQEFYYYLGVQGSSKGVLFLENVVTTTKWLIPALLVLLGCNSEKRTNETIFVLAVVVFILGVQIIRSMGLGLITDGDALQKRAVRIMDRDIGFHRNQISLWMAGGFWFIWFLMMESKEKFKKVVLIAVAGVVFLGLVLTGSRGGLLTWAICGAVFAWLRFRRLLIVGPLVVLIAVAFVPALQERVMQTINPQSEIIYLDDEQGDRYASASAGRTVLWSRVIDKIEERPLAGYGREAMINTGISLELLQQYDRSMAAKHPHNAYLQLVLDNGLIGLMIVLLFFGTLIRRSARMVNSEDQHTRLVGGVGVAWLVSFMAAGITAQRFYPNEGSIFVWCVAAMVIRQGFESRKVSTERSMTVRERLQLLSARASS